LPLWEISAANYKSRRLSQSDFLMIRSKCKVTPCFCGQLERLEADDTVGLEGLGTKIWKDVAKIYGVMPKTGALSTNGVTHGGESKLLGEIRVVQTT
jgi:hypothetical protein